jgi:hypothetical protein
VSRTRLQGWRALPARERLLLLRLLAGLPLVALALRLFDYRRTRRLTEWLSRHPNPRPPSGPELREAERLAQLAATAGHNGLVKATCLRQALLVHGMLRRRGLEPELKLGVRRDGEAFAAHAWVELAGQRLAQSDVQFASFDEPPGTTP